MHKCIAALIQTQVRGLPPAAAARHHQFQPHAGTDLTLKSDRDQLGGEICGRTARVLSLNKGFSRGIHEEHAGRVAFHLQVIFSGIEIFFEPICQKI